MRVAMVSMETTRTRDTLGVRRFERIARLLADRGHDVTIFCAQWWDDYRDTHVADGVRYCGVTFGRALTSFCTRIPYLLARYRPDVVHVRPTPPEQVPAARSGSRLARAPLLAEWYGDERLPDDSRTGQWAATLPDRTITPSELVRTQVRERGADGDDVSVIPEGIDVSLVDDIDPAKEIDVAYAHPLDESANIEALFLALAELRERGWSARIIGDGPMREEYEQQAEDLRIDDRVEFVGACDRQQRLAIYRGAHAFVQTAYREYFATELLWALACGCVGIVEYQAESSAHELIENYDRSFRVTDPQTLADAIVDAGGFEYRDRDTAWDRFDHDEVIEQYLDTYNSLRESYGLLA